MFCKQVQRRVGIGQDRGSGMVSTEWLEAEVLKAVPDASVEVIDLHRSGDHFHIRITSPTFEGMRPLQRQKIVLAHMKQYIPRPVHALDLKCMTPEQAAVTGDTAFDPHGGGQGVHIRRINRQKEE
jgi:stress-induced morphogen